MKRVVQLLFVFLLFVTLGSARDGESLANARRAQAMLGAEVWSQVIRIENTGRSHRYPRQVEALVFELAGLLWFYTDSDGTQSFSTHRGRLDRDKADFAALLREIDPGFAAWTPVADDARPALEKSATRGPLLNGCFVESVANLRARLAAGEAVGQPQLLSYYVDSGGQRLGHTVLAYRTDGGLRVIDPLEPERPHIFPDGFAGGDPRALATALFGRGVAKASWLAVRDFTPPLSLAATAGARVQPEARS